jgi:hypothetical protein
MSDTADNNARAQRYGNANPKRQPRVKKSAPDAHAMLIYVYVDSVNLCSGLT